MYPKSYVKIISILHPVPRFHGLIIFFLSVFFLSFLILGILYRFKQVLNSAKPSINTKKYHVFAPIGRF